MKSLGVVMPIGEFGVMWQATPRLDLALNGQLPISTETLRRDLGTDNLTTFAVSGIGRYVLGRSGSRWQPTLGVALSLIYLEFLPRPAPGKRAGTPLKALGPLPTVEFGLRWQSHQSWAFFASLRAAYSLYVQDTGVLPKEAVSDLGRPVFSASLGVEWRAIAWGTRD